MQKLKWFVREVYKPPLTLCHGDVHMDNIFFDEAFPTGLKMIDFGDAKEFTDEIYNYQFEYDDPYA